MNTLIQNPRSADNRSALYTLMTVWFFWSFVATCNCILIPLFNAKFGLSQTQAQYIDFAFYAGFGGVIYSSLVSGWSRCYGNKGLTLIKM